MGPGMGSPDWMVAQYSAEAVSRRLALLALERPWIASREIRKALVDGQATVSFCVRHHVSLDWLWLGDLHGLLRMTKWRSQMRASSCR